MLSKYRLLDRAPEERFNWLTYLAARHFQAPMALIALVDQGRQWCKSCIGVAVSEVERDVEFCRCVIQADEVFVVNDAIDDPRFHENPLVTAGPFIRFYAGAPLIVEEGLRLGAFAIMDRRPRAFSAEDRQALRGFASLAADFIRQQRAGFNLSDAERALVRSESLYGELVENSVTGIYRSSAQGEVLMANRAVLDMLGYASLEELQQRNIERDHLTEARAQFKRAMEEQRRVESFENVWYRKDGTPVLVSETARMVRNAAGEVLYYEGTVENVTTRRNAELHIRKSEERYRLLFDSNPLAALVYSTDSNFNILAANAAAVKVYGYTPEEFRSLTMLDLASEDKRGAMLERIQGILRNHPDSVARSAAFPHRTKIGQRIEVEITSHPLEFDNRPARLVMINDVTELVETQTRMREALDLAQSATIAKSDFLATMSHEIRTPIHGVIGMTGLLCETELSPEQREYAELIRSSGQALLTLVNDILDFSKIESGNLKIEAVTFDLWTMAEECVDMVAETAHRKNLELVADIGSSVPMAVTGDPQRIRQILLNLLSNAIKFTPEGEVRLHLTERENAVDAPPAAGRVIRFEVIDTGIGIAPEAKERLFQSFSQGDPSTSRRFGGTGLGLAISKRLAQIMGGVIGFESEPGEGARFWVELPLQLAPREPTQAASPLIGKHVLIVDDHSCTLRVLRQQLERLGASVTTASSGATAADVLRHGAASMDACLIDSDLAGVSGIETARQLRTLKGRARLPVALLTRVTERNVMADASTRRCVDIACAKPLKRAQLISTVTRLMEHVEAKSGPAAGPVSRQAPPLGEGIRILLAEDNLVNQKLAVQLVRKLGHNVDVASNGRQATEMFQSAPYQMILMDAQMPEMDGYEATRFIRAMEKDGHHAVIIGLTANVMPGDLEKCLGAGMDDYVPKPIQVAAFQQTLSAWMERIRKQRV